MRPAAIIVALVAALLLSSSVFVVNERELAVLFQFGAVQRTDFAPGLHFKLPLVQNVRKYDRRILTVDTEPERYLTSEKKDVFVDFFVKWKIADVGKFYTATAGDELLAAQRLSPIVRASLRQEISERKLQEVLSGRGDVIGAVIAKADEALVDLGVDVVDVRIVRIDLPDNVSESVYRRMRAERTKVANDLRATGQEAAETIRAEADRQRQVILAEAQRDSQTARGTGDAKAAEIYAKAYGRDAEFYAFYRSLEAYRQSFRDKDGVLVLDPDSEFFQYFGEGLQKQ
jgi:membrane protease subunit HflC